MLFRSEQLAAPGEVKLNEIGVKPGEKMYEELLNEEEIRRTYEIENFFVTLPAFEGRHEDRYPLVRGCQKPDRSYNSSVEPAMSFTELAEYFSSHKIL